MAKKKLDMSKLTLGAAKPIVKKTPTTGDKAVASIHQAETIAQPIQRTSITTPVVEEVRKEIRKEVIPATEAPKERKPSVKKTRKLSTNKKDLTRITVDVEKPLHKRIKIKALNQDVSIREYIINLVEKDLQKK